MYYKEVRSSGVSHTSASDHELSGWSVSPATSQIIIGRAIRYHHDTSERSALQCRHQAI